MSEPPRRGRIQIHLSTAVVMMLAAGGLMALNLVPEQAFKSFRARGGGFVGKRVALYGWPQRVNEYVGVIRVDGGPGPRPIYVVTEPKWVVSAMVVDAVVAVAVLLGVWMVCEWRIRRAGSKEV